MKGLEPSTFCMANARDRPHPFASVRSNHCLQRLRVGRANRREPERTPSAAIAAIVIVATFNLRCPVRDPAERPPLTSASVADQSAVGEDFAANLRDRT
jgi:hypothetical protein